MDTLVFLGVLACLGLVLVWYFVNDLAGANGDRGLLAIGAPDKDGLHKARAYRLKKRGASGPGVSARARLRARIEDEADSPAFHEKSAGGAFHEKADHGYRTKGPLPRFGQKPPRQ